MSEQAESIKKVSLIVSKGSLVDVYPALVLGNGARMEGIEAAIFFTFFGLGALIKKTQNKLKVATVGNPALNMALPMLKMPITTPFPTLMGAIPGVSNFATWMMKNEMEDLDIPTIPEFIEMFTDAGGEVYACKLGMDMFKLSMDDLDDRVSGVLTVGEFYEKSAGASIIFT
ncbi:MAG: DsrE/DsrF/DrsH-like family protein [Candidatus Marinimicrobia bacterium]|nr:DsrE/DsrF/DrsH-like family protein [Candidatus Neomarinimicrobiota bacterium]